MNILKSKKGMSSVEIVTWGTVAMVIFTMCFVFKEPVVSAFTRISPNVVSVQYEEVGKVVEKNIVPGYRGSRHYLIAVETEDKDVIELDGEETYYKVSVGDEVKLEKTVFKNKNTNAVVEEDYELKE